MARPTTEHNNSPEYWEERFSSRDWDKSHGEAQTRFFGQLLVRLLPGWAAAEIRAAKRCIVDLGCAEGAGTAELGRAFPGCVVRGVDFAPSAVARAAQLHPHVEFAVGDLFSPPADAQVLVLSNVLEHLGEPVAALRALAAAPAARYVAALVPLHEVVRHHEHVVTFDYNNFPLRLGRLGLAAFQEVDLRGTPDERHWYGKQAFALWAHDELLEQLGPTLQDVLGAAQVAQRRLTAAQEAMRRLEQADRRHLAELSELRRRYAEALVELQRREALEVPERRAEPASAEPVSSRVVFLPDRGAEAHAAELRRSLDALERSLRWRVSRAAVRSLERAGLGPVLALAHSLDEVGPRRTAHRVRRKLRRLVAQARRPLDVEVDPWVSLSPLRPLPVELFDDDFAERWLPAFSVVTTVRDEAEGIVAFLRSIARQRALPAEVIVVDGGSSDETVALVREFARRAPFALRVIDEGPCNIAAGRNRGLRQASEELVVFVDAGCTLRSHFFSAMVGPFAGNPDCDLVGGIYVAAADAPAARAFVPDWRECDYNHYLPSARAVAVRTTLARTIGGFPEHLSHTGEDTLFDIAYRRVSRAWAVNRAAVVEWSGPRTEEAALRLARSYSRGDGESGVGDRRFGRWLTDQTRGTLGWLEPAEAAALEGFLDGRERRKMVELERRRVRGVVLVLDPAQLTDFGGDREIAEVATELTRQGFKVVHVSALGPDVAGQRYLDIDQSLLELYHLNDFDLGDLVRRYGEVLAGVLVVGGHPAFEAPLRALKRRLPRVPVVLDEPDEVVARRLAPEVREAALRVLRPLADGRVGHALRPGRGVLPVRGAVDQRLYVRGAHELRPRTWPSEWRERVTVVPFPYDVTAEEVADLRALARGNPGVGFVALVPDWSWAEVAERWGFGERNVSGSGWATPDELAGWAANAAALVLPWSPEAEGRRRWLDRWAARAAAVQVPAVAVASDDERPGAVTAARPALASLVRAVVTNPSVPESGALATTQGNVHRLLDLFYDVGR